MPNKFLYLFESPDFADRVSITRKEILDLIVQDSRTTFFDLKILGLSKKDILALPRIDGYWNIIHKNLVVEILSKYAPLYHHPYWNSLCADLLDLRHLQYKMSAKDFYIIEDNW